jgi:hypothetical protein
MWVPASICVCVIVFISVCAWYIVSHEALTGYLIALRCGVVFRRIVVVRSQKLKFLNHHVIVGSSETELLILFLSSSNRKTRRPLSFMLAHAANPHQNLKWEKVLNERFNVKAISSLCITPILGVHTGPTVSLFGWCVTE